MPTPAQPPAFSFESVDAQRVEDALALMGPKWTTWTVMTMLQEGRPVRVRDVAARLPFVSEQLVGKRLATMRTDGLVIRADTGHGAPYRLSALGESLTPVHRTLADWSRNYLSAGATAEAERVEDAVQRLRLRHTTAMVQALDKGGPMRFVHIAEQAGLDYAFTQHRLLRLQADGLVTRTDPRHGAPYVLTYAGRALGPVYAVVDHWSAALPTRWTPPPPAPVTAAQRTHPGIPLGADGARTAAALRRSTAVPASLFSHAPQPQPRVPSYVTAQSTPGRSQ
ncbi:winged helix-turn-helix transcriptional regulator [Streptomyces sp. DSM 41972]|uniref:Winged helix-turn-helix transcriptional regulator n=1 Tax=Streptomyces althioticus subsp. attaecolombicae TaxID=3075534 RepID=A0ABU3HXJ9_9ACTN|nr:winged helix-turn-helix transcriptional regulator [Streptomyces sp. DSM 41972]SCD64916.1 transcriptional regulator, HxlR family [Streptomyces sp. di50b]SCD69835.1 transcriptional regulator, HxlR family [Streptomyces sp. di188]